MKFLFFPLLLSANVLLSYTVAADNRFAENHEMPEAVPGLQNVELARFNDKILQLGRMFAAMEEVNAPPPKICTNLGVRTHSQILADSLMSRPMATGGASVALAHFKDTCWELTNNGVGVVLNSPAAVVPKSRRIAFADRVLFALPAVKNEAPGRLIFQNGELVFTPVGIPFYLPVTKEEYLTEIIEQHRQQLDAQREFSQEFSEQDTWREWLEKEKPAMLAANAETLEDLKGMLSESELEKMRLTLEQMVSQTETAMREMAQMSGELNSEVQQGDETALKELALAEAALAALNQIQRRAPACVDAVDPRSAGPESCPPGTMIVRLNPGLFANVRSPAEVRLVYVSPGVGFLNKLEIEDQHFYDLRMAIYRKLDLKLLAGLID